MGGKKGASIYKEIMMHCKESFYEKSILIFDEFLTNNSWEEDEYKALNEFCNNFNISYEVLAVSFYSKQIAIKLQKKR